MVCEHEHFRTEYGTRVCKLCGIEQRVGLPSFDRYTSNCPLVIGYSRNTRVKSILEQLFRPFTCGNPCHEILYIIQKNRLTFETGEDIHSWLNEQLVKNKKYTCCHYYFAFANSWYKVPPPPSQQDFWALLTEFYSLEFKFNMCNHGYKSFFSYNWLLRELLTQFELTHYVQFIKPIKCKGRRSMYSNMLSTLQNSCIREVKQEPASSSPQRPFSPRGYAHRSLRQLSLNFSNRGTKTVLSMLKVLT